MPEGWELEILDVNLPLFNQDLIAEDVRPREVTEFKSKVQEADAILFACAEYNFR